MNKLNSEQTDNMRVRDKIYNIKMSRYSISFGKYVLFSHEFLQIQRIYI